MNGRVIEIARAIGDPKASSAAIYTFIRDKASSGTYPLYMKMVLGEGQIRFSPKVGVVVR